MVFKRDKEPTAPQLEVLELVEQGLSIKEISDKIGRSTVAVNNRLNAAKRKSSDYILERFPKAADFLVIFKTGDGGKRKKGPPVQTQTKAAPKKELPISDSSYARLKQRISYTKTDPVKTDGIETLTDEQLKNEVRKKLSYVLNYIDGFSLGTAKLSELSSTFKTLFEAQQLMEGKPTMIMSKTDREDLQKLVPMLIEEAKRRGLPVKGMKDITNQGEVLDMEREDRKRFKEGKVSKVKKKSAGRHPKNPSKAYCERHGLEYPYVPVPAKKPKKEEKAKLESDIWGF